MVTGGLGFLGIRRAIRLVELGAEVTLLDGIIPDLGANFFNIEPVKDRVKVVIANLVDRAATDYYVKDKDLVYNIGMHLGHLESMANPVYDLETNVIPQVHFRPPFAVGNPQTRVVYIGTLYQDGQALTIPITEETPPNPKDI